jgi:hypothetical protein
MVNFLRTALIVILFLQVNLVFAQETRIIRIQSGGTVNFNINSYKKYKEGMELNNWTLLTIDFSDPAPATSWRLDFVALKPTIEGDYLGASDLDLNLIKLKVESEGATDLSGFIQDAGEYFLTFTEQPIVLNAPQGGFSDNRLRVSYSLGPVLDNPANYYFVDIEFILSRVP